jgi:tRNA(fMet)-specific endonuclease VapC
MIRFALPLLMAAGLSVPALAQPSVHGHASLLHGNYCGPGNNAPLPPIDALDAACARHDACTPDGALASRGCNLRLQRDADRIAHDPRQPDDLRAMAGLVAAGASLMPSDPGRAVPTVTGSLQPATGPQDADPGLDTETDDEGGED